MITLDLHEHILTKGTNEPSLVPSPVFFRAGRRAGEKNGPGIYCLRMRQSIWALTFDPGVKTSP